MEISTIGLDLAKSVFQVHGIDAAGNVLVRKALRRAQMLPFFSKHSPCLVGMEACGTSHHWARLGAAGPSGSPDAAGLRDAVRKARQKRCS
jgi:transposase